MTSPVKLLSAAIGLIALDAMMSMEIASFIRQCEFYGCGTWAGKIAFNMTFFGVISLPIGFCILRSCWFARTSMHPFTLFCIRLPVFCMVGLLATYFIAIPVVNRFL